MALLVIVKFAGVYDLFSFQNLQSNKAMLQQLVSDRYLVAVAVFVLTYVAVIAVSIPGAAILTLTSGFLFGSVLGTVYTNIGATTGAVIIFLVSRYLGGGWIQKKYHDKLQGFNREFARHGHNYLLTLRFIPIFPFWFVNIFSGMTKVRLRTFVWTTSLGIIPGSFVYAFAGSQLSTISSLSDVLSFRVILSFLLLGVLAISPVAYRKIGDMRKKSIASRRRANEKQ